METMALRNWLFLQITKSTISISFARKIENCRRALGVQRTSLAFAVEGGKCCERADQDGKIGQRDS